MELYPCTENHTQLKNLLSKITSDQRESVGIRQINVTLFKQYLCNIGTFNFQNETENLTQLRNFLLKNPQAKETVDFKQINIILFIFMQQKDTQPSHL